MPLKAALCFIINYDHELIKEDIWKKWIEPNKDIINIYFFYENYSKIKSEWIKKHVIPQIYIKPTTYLNVLPAYIQLLNYSVKNKENEWFIFLTDFCIPIISPEKFRTLFFMHHNKTFMGYKKAWWDVNRISRANLKELSSTFHLANSPWFTLTRKHVHIIKKFIKDNENMCNIIHNGNVANESFFAIAFKFYNCLNYSNDIMNIDTHLSDWSKMTSATSPNIFNTYNEENKNKINDLINNNEMAMFLRKIGKDFPDTSIITIWDLNNKNKIEYPTIFKMPLYFYLPVDVYHNKNLIAIKFLKSISLTIVIFIFYYFIYHVYPNWHLYHFSI